MYRGWLDLLPIDINLFAAQLPGREEAYNRPFQSDIGIIAKGITQELPDLTAPLFVFGHSLGAWIALRVVERLAHESTETSIAFLSGITPYSANQIKLSHLADHELRQQLFRLNGTDPQILQDRNLLSILLTRFREDMKIVEDPATRVVPTLNCPIVALAGSLEYEPEELDEWSSATSSWQRSKFFEGGHFYLFQNSAELVHYLAEEITTFTSNY
jgi:medium-chain acyl-[acyl-carrier-protein] hydrolase